MCTDHDSVLVRNRERCAVCTSKDFDMLLDLPALPLTGLFSRQPLRSEEVRCFDQSLLFCNHCGHAQLGKMIAPEYLYSGEYSFRTSVSATARQGTEFFLGALNRVAPGKKFRCVLDLGCNDLHLLKQLGPRASQRIGVDPVWAGKEDCNEDPTIIVIGSTIEAADLGAVLDGPVDLVLCRHTLEHIDEPRAVLETLFNYTTKDTLFLFEIPGFDNLVDRLRFDQVFHQHLQYFSLASFCFLLDEVGAEYLGCWENYHDWGAMVIAFKHSSRVGRPAGETAKLDTELIKSRYSLFSKEMQMTAATMMSLKNTPIYGYGAAQMLPILAYHMKTDFSELTAVLDDDKSKAGYYYSNLPVAINEPSTLAEEWGDISVLLTAVDNGAKILQKLIPLRPKKIVLPLRMF